MEMNPAGAAAMAGGQPPQQPAGQMTVAAQGNTATTQINEVLNALKQILPQVVDERGYVNMDRLITMWPQVSRVPFQVVMQLIQQNPEILNNIITQYGLNGIVVQGRIIGAEELASLGGRGGGV
jgi:hypothetical protein